MNKIVYSIYDRVIFHWLRGAGFHPALQVDKYRDFLIQELHDEGIEIEIDNHKFSNPRTLRILINIEP